jgi:magnesium chelatase family protein
MVNIVKTATVIGITAYEVSVETDVANSLPGMAIVGLPDASVNEARDRVKSAIKNSGYSFPSKKVIINLAPADLKKAGTSFDLPIAVGILTEEEVMDSEKTKDYHRRKHYQMKEQGQKAIHLKTTETILFCFHIL